MNNASSVISKILRSKGYTDPKFQLYIINEITKNTTLMDIFYKFPQDFINRVSDNKFLDMLLSKSIQEAKTQKEAIPQGDQTNQISPSNSQISQVQTTRPSHAEELSWLYKNADGSRDTEGEDREVINVLPDIDNVYLINHDLVLDLSNDLAIDDCSNLSEGNFQLQFSQYSNISKIEIVNFNIDDNMLEIFPYIYIKIAEINGRCNDSKQNTYFGKLIYTNNGTCGNCGTYIPDIKSCIQVFSNPCVFNKLTISFYDHKSNQINLQKIEIDSITKNDSSMNIKTKYKHNLSKNDDIIIYVFQHSRIDVHQIVVNKIVSDKEFVINNEINDENIEIYRRYLKSNITFRMSEINMPLLTGKEKSNLHLVDLNNLINSKRILK